MSTSAEDEGTTDGESKGRNEIADTARGGHLRDRIGALGHQVRDWARGPADPPGAPFAAVRRRLIVVDMVVVAVVLGVVGIAVYFYDLQAERQQTIAQLQYYATTGGATAAEHGGGPPGGDNGPPPRLVPYSPTTPDIFSVVLSPSGTVRFDSDQVVQLGVPVVAAAKPVLQGQQAVATPIMHANGHAFQLYITRVVEHGQLEWVVVAGTSLDLQGQELSDLIRALAAVYGVVLVLTFLTSVFVTRRGLEPARQAFARQRQFATAASHELRTPLAVIRSEAELVTGLIGDSLEALRKPHAQDSEITANLEEAQSETRAVTSEIDFMTQMVQDLLLLARDASDQTAHEWTDVDLRRLVEDVAGKMRPVAESAGLTLQDASTEGHDARPIWVRGDPGLLRQLLYALLENAVRYTPSGGRIRVAVQADDRRRLLGDRRRHAQVTVSDTGVGIASEHLGNIFEPFYRAVSSTRPLHGEQHGTGLGLALAQWIVRAHGGSIQVQSEVGRGTTFTVELPLGQADLDRTAPEERSDLAVAADGRTER